MNWARSLNPKGVGRRSFIGFHTHRTSDDEQVELKRRREAANKGITILGRM